LDKIAKEKLEPFILKSYTTLAKVTNAYDQKMIMSREVIADKGIWTAKKRYILNCWDIEGVRYKEPHLKIMGIEAVKSSTPAPCRAKIKEALERRYGGVIAEAKANVEVYLTNPAGIGEHPDIIGAIDTQMERIAEAEDKLLALEKHFMW
jgi:hypothetical protein